MTEFSGSALYMSWIHPAGTVVLSADYRKVSYSPTLNFIDATSGSDPFEVLLPGIGTGGDVDYTAVMQSGGTALIAAVAKATQGTIIIGPEGTATNKPKLTIPAISKGPNLSEAYDGIAEFNVSFKQSANETWGAW